VVDDDREAVGVAELGHAEAAPVGERDRPAHRRELTRTSPFRGSPLGVERIEDAEDEPSQRRARAPAEHDVDLEEAAVVAEDEPVARAEAFEAGDVREPEAGGT